MTFWARCRQRCLRLLFPPLPFVLAGCPLAAGLLILVFVKPAVPPPLRYAAYLFSAYALAIFCARLPRLFRQLRQLALGMPLVRRYLQDVRFRIILSLVLSLAVSGLYTLLQAGLGFWHRSLWYGALAVYYALLFLMRFPLLSQALRGQLGQKPADEYVLYRRCGIILTATTFALSTIAFYIVCYGRGVSHHPITTIAIAAYTFFSLTMAIIQAVRCRRFHSPVLAAARSVGLASALVSMLVLETAMLSAFGGEADALFRHRMTAVSGGLLCLSVLGMGIFMTVRGNRALRALRQGGR